MYNKRNFPAVVLGGGTLKGKNQIIPKAFLDIDGRVLASAAVGSVDRNPDINQIILVSDLLLGRKYFGDRVNKIVEPGRDVIDSMMNGAEELPSNDPALVICADQPFIKQLKVSDFIRRCRDHPDADVWLGYVSKEKAEAIIPKFDHTYAYLVEHGYVCMAGIAMLRPKVLHHPSVRKLAKHRKNVALLLAQLGWRLILPHLRKRLSSQEVEHVLSQHFGCKVVGVEADATFGFDADNNKRLDLCRAYLSAQH